MTNTTNADGLPTTTSFMTGSELAILLRTNPETIRYWRHISYGPPGIKVGRHVLYGRADVDSWVAERRHLQAGPGEGTQP